MPHFSNMTDKYRIPKESHQTGIADAYTYNAAMDLIDELLGGFGDAHWKPPVTNVVDLPLTGNEVGDARVVTSTVDIWMWDGASWKKSNRALIYRGVWDANLNLPHLTSGVGNQGDYYVVSVSGSTNLDGITDWVVGDWAIFNGVVWEKADHTDAVSSVFGRKGAVTAQAGDYTHAQLAGIGTDDHHAKMHAHDGLDGSGQVAHANLTGIGADDHHAKSHAHNGLDGSGQVAHSSLTGIGSDDHHARQHALSSALDHTGSITDAQHGSRSGGTLHPVATPDPAGVAGFMSGADKAKLDSIAGTGRVYDYQWGRNTQVPGLGTLQLWGPGPTATALRCMRAGSITAAAIQVGVIDAARAYQLEIHLNGVLVQAVALPINTLGNQALFAIPTAVVAGDLITTFMVRTAGGGASTFSDMQAVVEVTC